jgi:alpha-glucuronidase
MHPGEWSRGNRSQDQFVFLVETFRPLDGTFDSNVVLQMKTGPGDFQVREPVQSLWYALKHTPVVMEVEISQTFTGQVSAERTNSSSSSSSSCCCCCM